MMIKKILVGTDFSTQAALAVEAAIALATKHGAELTLVHAVNLSMLQDGAPYLTSMPASYFSRVDTLQAELRTKLAADFEKLTGHGVSVSMLFVDQAPEIALVRVAKEQEADLIVVGSHGRSGIKRFLLGSVSETVARDAECDVMVVRAQVGAEGYQRILVPTDFSECSEKAVARAIALAADEGVIELLHCWQLPGGPVSYWGTVGDDLRRSFQEGAEVFGAKCMSQHEGAKVTLEFLQQEGDVRELVVARGEKGDVDLVVLGTHGRTGLQGFLVGSIAHNVLRHASNSVYLVR